MARKRLDKNNRSYEPRSPNDSGLPQRNPVKRPQLIDIVAHDGFLPIRRREPWEMPDVQPSR